ncbi:immunoglobulin kappa light chain-like [Scomber scombrus]
MVSVSCRTSADVDGDCSQSKNLPHQSWNQPTGVVTGAGNMRGTPAQLSAARSGRKLAWSIGGVQDEEAQTLDLTSLGTGVSVPPSVSLLPPSAEQLAVGEATLVCVLSDYTPQGATVSWAVDGSDVTEGLLTGEEVQKDGGKFVRSSTLTMSKEEWEKRDLYACKVSHDGSERSAELRRTQCSGQ